MLVFGWILRAMFWLTLVGLIGLIAIFIRYGNDLPDYQGLATYRPPIATRLYAADGSLLIEYAAERRVFIEYYDIPAVVVNAFVAAEDQNFWTHPGIDIMGITRAMMNNTIRMLGGPARFSGASTITQQVAKNFFLSREQSISRKIREMLLALKLERTFSKEHIMTLYLNQIYLGARAYGIGAASLMYFNKPVNELTLSEAAFLASLPKAPNNYNPTTNYNAAIGRRNWVIDRMKSEGYVTSDQANEAKQSDLKINNDFMGQQKEDFLYFAEEVRRRLLDQLGREKLYEDGLYIKTTLDPKLQIAAMTALRRSILDYDRERGYHGPESRVDLSKPENSDWARALRRAERALGMPESWRPAIVLSVGSESADIGFESGTTDKLLLSESKWARKNNPETQTVGSQPTDLKNVVKRGDVIFVEKSGAGYALRQSPKIQGGMIAINPHTGRIVAVAGGFSFNESSFNRATQARRQPGSTIKPFIYLNALERANYNPTTLILDAPIVGEKEDGSLWKPVNYDKQFKGEMPLRLSLETSRNVTTVRLVQDLGVRNVIDTAKKFGVYNDSLSNINLSLALGSGETTLENMTLAFSAFINGGHRIESSLVDYIQDRDGKTLFNNRPVECEKCNTNEFESGDLPPSIEIQNEPLSDPASLYQVVSILQGVVERGTGKQAAVPGHTIAGKTGTTNDVKDVWFVGFSKDLAVGVYLGFDQPKTLGPGSGSHMAARVFSEFMTTALAGKTNQPFPVPAGLTFMRVQRETGKIATPGMGGTIINEVFKPEQLKYMSNNPTSTDRNVNINTSSPSTTPAPAATVGGFY